MVFRRFITLAAVFACLTGLAQAAEPAAGRTEPAGAGPSSVPNPVVTGPITGGIHGRPQFDPPFRPEDYGYRRAEYFVSGVARDFATGAGAAPYATRIVVYRPIDPARFSGNAVLEWNNTTGQIDTPVEFMWGHRQVFAQGDAYVQVSAQQAGVCGMGLSGAPGAFPAPVCTPVSLKGWDPVRYGPLVHPGDGYSYDIFSQAARAVRDPAGLAPLDGLTPRTVIAVGESQSAIALDNYIRNGADDAARVLDGFVIDADGHTAEPTAYRVPTLTVWSEESARPVPSTTGNNHVIWPVAGAAHTDHALLSDAVAWAGRTLGDLPVRTPAEQSAADAANGDYGQEGPGPSVTCAGNDQFPRRYLVDAALAAVETWAGTGTPAPSAPPLAFTGFARRAEQAPLNPLNDVVRTLASVVGEVNTAAILGAPWALVRDGDGNAVGGLRLPVLTVPVARYDGSACIAAGTTTPLPPERLRQLYPTHADYVARMLEATKDSVAQRYLTRPDAIDLLTRACDSAVPEWGHTPRDRQPRECLRLGEALG